MHKIIIFSIMQLTLAGVASSIPGRAFLVMGHLLLSTLSVTTPSERTG